MLLMKFYNKSMMGVKKVLCVAQENLYKTKYVLGLSGLIHGWKFQSLLVFILCLKLFNTYFTVHFWKTNI